MRNSMRTLLALAALLAVALVGASWLGAEDATPSKPEASQTVGTLTAINAVTRTLEVRTDKTIRKFFWDASTVVVENDRRIEAANLDKGDKLKIDWQMQGELRVASRVEVLPAVEATASR